MKVRHVDSSGCLNTFSFNWVAGVLLVVLFSLPGCTVKQLALPETASNKLMRFSKKLQ